MRDELISLRNGAINTCRKYLNQYIKHEVIESGIELYGWHHFIDDVSLQMVGSVATAQMMILASIYNWSFIVDNSVIIESLIRLQAGDGGWCYRTNVNEESAVEPTAWAVIALSLNHSEKYNPAIISGLKWICAAVNSEKLWGPFSNTQSRIYYSCLSLIALTIVKDKISYLHGLRDVINRIIDNAAAALFSLSNGRGGWGITLHGSATTFHTAFALVTLLILDDSRYHYSRDKASEFIAKAIANDSFTGDKEDYQHGHKRLTHYNSAMIYAYLSQSWYQIKSGIPDSTAQHFFLYSRLEQAQRGDWVYSGINTSWRLYDIMLYIYVLSPVISEINKNNSEELKMSSKRFKVAFSFSSEIRDYVRKIADLVAVEYGKAVILFDEYHTSEFSGPNLDLRLQQYYHDESELQVLFFSPEYKKNPWCGLEWKAIRDLINQNKANAMFIKAGNTPFDIPGLFDTTDGFIYTKYHTPEKIASMIVERYKM